MSKKSTRKQTKIVARLAETGRLVEAMDDDDWALVHRPGDPDRPILHCPESSAGCANQLTAVENRVRADGGRLRSFRFTKNTAEQDRCQHALADPVLVGGNESAEHRWLKEYVYDTTRELGYTAQTERPLDSGLVADVWVDDAKARRRVEVQRVITDIPARTDPHADVVWLLREQSRNNKAMNNHLFTNPCVRVNIYDRARKPAAPWSDPDVDFKICVYAAVLRRAKSPRTPKEFFETGELPLRTFLREVWSGERKWVDDVEVYNYATWVRVSDLEERQEWMQARREQAAVAQAAELAARRERQPQIPERRAAVEAGTPTRPSPQPLATPPPPTPLTTAPSDSSPQNQRPPLRPPNTTPAWRRFIAWLRGS